MKPMISIKKYLDEPIRFETKRGAEPTALLPATIAAYSASLREIASCSLMVCPASGENLKQSLTKLEEKLDSDATPAAVEATGKSVREQLRVWGRDTARRFQQTTDQVKEILIVMARTAESVGRETSDAPSRLVTLQVSCKTSRTWKI